MTSKAKAAAGAPLPPIYQWLPFTPSALASAARVVLRFGDDYGTFSYRQNADAYLAPMRGLTSATLAAQLGAAYSAPGLASQRDSSKQISAATAAIRSLRDFGPSSITFVVAVTQHLTGTSGRTESATAYAVTVTGTAGTWQVTDVELASAGNS